MSATPLLDEHRALDAHFTDFAGWQMPLKYGSELTEHHAVRTAAGLFDLSHMGEIAVTGPGAAAALDHALSGELSRVAIGRAKYSLLCDADGGVLDDLVIYRLADEHFLVVANAANTSTVLKELCFRATSFDAIVEDQSATTALIAVQGPLALSIVASLSAEPSIASGLRYYAAAPAVVADVDVLLSRTGYTGEDGFELYLPNAQAPALWRGLLAATLAVGGLPAGLACRDTLRLEAGMALYGNELSADVNPYEAGLGRVVALSKDFVGRAALQRLSAQGPARVLVGLSGEGRRAARAGYPVLADGEPIGAVTSGALSPTLGHPIALAYVDPAVSEVGTTVDVDIRGKSVPYEITAFPFYRRS
ncbi:glycine cleavage system aminomethyltransferase GcvT [Tomitella biformata]|uniref:glycine cleavage system aminomethyltransferase GcvT n=1 Tax=Tomitella biformata TaxID=630403 RepID=UPI000467384F|nr:glycine cleavage system aminomethyltransferase GcvT [Tomitella biformata]